MWHDFRQGIRQLLRGPGFAITAILSLALGIGANTAIFSFVNAVLLRTLPVTRPEELITISSKLAEGFVVNSFSKPFYEGLRDGNTVLAGLAAQSQATITLAATESAELVRGELVSGNYFEVLGVRPQLGRLIERADDRAGAAPVCLLSYALWQRRFGSDSGIIGRTVTLNNAAFTVAGVTAQSFTGADLVSPPEVYVALAARSAIAPRASSVDRRGMVWLSLIGRLRPGVSRTAAQSSLDALAAQLGPDQKKGEQIFVLPGAQGMASMRKRYEQPLYILMAIVGVVLLVSCSNVANLLLARATARRKEISIRLAMGAGRGRLIRQLLLESLVLAAAGGLLGMLLAAWSTELLAAIVPRSGAEGLNVQPDLRVLAFTAALSTVVGLLFGLAPALQATRPNLMAVMKNETGTPRTGRLWGRKLLVASQVALSVVLLAGAGLLLRTLQNLRSAPLGFERESVAMLTVHTANSGYPDARRRQIFAQVLDRAARIPGVRSASVALVSPISGGAWMWSVMVPGYQEKAGENLAVYSNDIGPGFFATIGQTVKLGREFTPDDRQGSPKVVVLNESFARHFWAGENPIGKAIGLGGDVADAVVVGVVADAKYRELRGDAPMTAYRPVWQQPSVGTLVVHVRATGNPDRVLGLVNEEVRSIDKRLPVTGATTMSAQVDEALAVERLLADLTTCFSALTLLLAATGLYGVMAYSVARRTREIGIRMALGAPDSSVLLMVLRESMAPVLAGVAAGIPAALAASQLLRTFLFGLKETDGAVYGSILFLLAAISVLAALLPARRAARVEPMAALRHD